MAVLENILKNKCNACVIFSTCYVVTLRRGEEIVVEHMLLFTIIVYFIFIIFYIFCHYLYSVFNDVKCVLTKRQLVCFSYLSRNFKPLPRNTMSQCRIGAINNSIDIHIAASVLQKDV